MPSLRQVTCKVVEAITDIEFKEVNVTYGDGVVECYLVVPDGRSELTIKLESQGYIAPGLAMFIYIDGIYQSNRNRCNLKLPANGQSMSCAEVNLKLSQKEAFVKGAMVATKWALHPLSERATDKAGVKNDDAAAIQSASTIEVLIFRCDEDSESSPLTILESNTATIATDPFPAYGRWGHHAQRINSLSGHLQQPLHVFGPLADSRERQAHQHSDSSWSAHNGGLLNCTKQARDSNPKGFDEEYDSLPANAHLIYTNNRSSSQHQDVTSAAEAVTKEASSSYVKAQQHLGEAFDAGKGKTSHALVTGKAYEYAHTMKTPKYIDTFKVPYAKFIFRYRGKAILEQIVGPIETTAEDAQTEFANKSKDQLIEELVIQRKKASTSSPETQRSVPPMTPYNINPYNIDQTSSAAEAPNSGPNWSAQPVGEGIYEWNRKKSGPSTFATPNNVADQGADSNAARASWMPNSAATIPATHGWTKESSSTLNNAGRTQDTPKAHITPSNVMKQETSTTTAAADASWTQNPIAILAASTSGQKSSLTTAGAGWTQSLTVPTNDVWKKDAFKNPANDAWDQDTATKPAKNGWDQEVSTTPAVDIWTQNAADTTAKYGWTQDITTTPATNTWNTGAASAPANHGWDTAAPATDVNVTKARPSTPSIPVHDSSKPIEVFMAELALYARAREDQARWDTTKAATSTPQDPPVVTNPGWDLTINMVHTPPFPDLTKIVNSCAQADSQEASESSSTGVPTSDAAHSGPSRAAAAASNVNPGIAENAAGLPPVRRRARAESFWTGRSASEVLDDTNEQPGYGSITTYERLIHDREARTRRISSAPLPAVPEGSKSEAAAAAEEEAGYSMPPEPHLNPFPAFDENVASMAAVRHRVPSGNVTTAATWASRSSAAASNYDANDEEEEDEPRGRTMRRRSDTVSRALPSAANLMVPKRESAAFVAKGEQQQEEDYDENDEKTPRPINRASLGGKSPAGRLADDGGDISQQ